MKVTLDSTESLQDALRLVGALYDVRLVVAGDGSDGRSDGEQPARASAPRPAGRRGRRRATTATTAELRSWARANGIDVNERGPVPAAVRDAYAAAN